MAVNEQISTGRFYRRLINETSKLWERISFWNKASDTECNDGQTVETKIGAFKGVTTSTNVTTTGFAADAKIVSKLNSNLGGFTPIIDSTGKITGYKTTAGADTVFPFKSGTTYKGLQLRVLFTFLNTERFAIFVINSNNEFERLNDGVSYNDGYFSFTVGYNCNFLVLCDEAICQLNTKVPTHYAKGNVIVDAGTASFGFLCGKIS